jgi:hypothetical protein
MNIAIFHLRHIDTCGRQIASDGAGSLYMEYFRCNRPSVTFWLEYYDDSKYFYGRCEHHPISEESTFSQLFEEKSDLLRQVSYDEILILSIMNS